MPTSVQEVTLLVENRPGVLDRIVGQIRREGWNIKSLSVDETDQPYISKMLISVEGLNTKLAMIVDRLIDLDCVIRIEMPVNGRLITRERPLPSPAPLRIEPEIKPAPPKPEGAFRILTINPGSTSTKMAVYDNERLIADATIRHSREELDYYPTITAQKELRRRTIIEHMKKSGVAITSLDAIAGRGGLLKAIVGGTYQINERMLEDLNGAAASIHASALGAIIAADIAQSLNIPAYVVDPIVVDEQDQYAKLSGMPGIERVSIFHALNQKAIARRCAEQIGKPYENLRLIVAHLGGGITVGAHYYGRVVDVNDALSGEGPFTPERCGAVPAVPLIRLCFSGEYSEQELIDKITKTGGMHAYLGTNDLKAVERMIMEGDEFAALVLGSMAYQVAKEIGAMSAVLDGRVDAIALTGGMAYSNRFTGAIKGRVDAIAPVYVYPGEDEMLALVSGALRVLRGQDAVGEYI